MVEGNGLENRRTLTRTVGSNPTIQTGINSEKMNIEIVRYKQESKIQEPEQNKSEQKRKNNFHTFIDYF